MHQCSSEQRAFFATIRTPFRRVPIRRLGLTESVLIVAEFLGQVLYYEDVEEGFEWCVLNDSGEISEQGCHQFELAHVLSQAMQLRTACITHTVPSHAHIWGQAGAVDQESAAP